MPGGKAKPKIRSLTVGALAAAAALSVLVLVVLPSFPLVRALLSAPLLVHDPAAAGDACYVLSGGGSLYERLDAAADLIQMRRVSRIFLMQDDRRMRYNFKTNSSWTRGMWCADYLAWRGVAPDRIRFIPQAEGPLGTLAEARSYARHRPAQADALVLVSSAPHLRRSMLAFQRSLPEGAHVVPYAATPIDYSYELYHPIWIEYLKLALYYLLA